MRFKMPNLGVLVNSNKELEENDSSRLIHVINHHAVVHNQICAIVNLRKYLKGECSIKDDNDIETMDEILDWMEGKSFTKEYWNELTKEVSVKLITDGIEVEHLSYSKQLIWENVFPDASDVWDSVCKSIGREQKACTTVAFKGENLSLVHKAFGNEVKGDSWLLDFSGNNHHMRFSGRSKSYIFGFIPLIADDADEIVTMLDAREFARELNEMV